MKASASQIKIGEHNFERTDEVNGDNDKLSVIILGEFEIDYDTPKDEQIKSCGFSRWDVEQMAKFSFDGSGKCRVRLGLVQQLLAPKMFMRGWFLDEVFSQLGVKHAGLAHLLAIARQLPDLRLQIMAGGAIDPNDGLPMAPAWVNYRNGTSGSLMANEFRKNSLFLDWTWLLVVLPSS